MSSEKEQNVTVGDNVNMGDSVIIASSPYARTGPFGQRVGFTCGSFDLLHPGHVIMLQEAKEVCDWLVVGVQSDPTIDRPQKNKPLQTHEERTIMVAALEYVDEVVQYNTEADLLQLLKKLAPDVRILGADHIDKEYTGKDLPIEVHFNKRDHDWSTTNLRKRVYESEKEKIDWNNARR